MFCRMMASVRRECPVSHGSFDRSSDMRGYRLFQLPHHYQQPSWRCPELPAQAPKYHSHRRRSSRKIPALLRRPAVACAGVARDIVFWTLVSLLRKSIGPSMVLYGSDNQSGPWSADDLCRRLGAVRFGLITRAITFIWSLPRFGSCSCARIDEAKL